MLMWFLSVYQTALKQSDLTETKRKYNYFYNNKVEVNHIFTYSKSVRAHLS